MYPLALDLIQPTGPELVPAAEASIPDAKRLVARCRDEGIDAVLGRTATCSSGGCTPKAQVLVRPGDVPRVSALLRRDWLEAAEREGTLDPELGARLRAAPASPSGDPPCPACGTAAPLVGGACSDCGLQLA
jgi:hypothetical protein